MPKLAALALALLMSPGIPLRATAQPAPAPTLPALPWEPRSDWTDVRTLGAAGDGKADDTAALQRAFSQVKSGATVYLPAGTYRITRSLKLTGPLLGVLVIGHGRDTVLSWDGPAGGELFVVDGIAYSRYVGLTFDGRGKAAVGLTHRAMTRFETEVLHQHLAFRAFTKVGIKAEQDDKFALAETTFDNCLFEDCGHGTLSTSFNDYNWTYDRCEFRRCGTGIECRHGNFYARNCHFEESTTIDVRAYPEHGSSLRRCTSLRSRQFLDFGNAISPLTVQDCRVAGWKSKDGAVQLHGAPVLLFDCGFADPPDSQPPVRILDAAQRLLLSENVAAGSTAVVGGKASGFVYRIPTGKRKGSVASAARSFLAPAVRIPGKVFDARRDFGALAKPGGDDTAAVQACIDAARKHGQGALAYLPHGEYTIQQTLKIAGADYVVGGSGYETRLVWKGAAGGTMVAVNHPDRITLQNLAVGTSEGGGAGTTQAVDILQAGGDSPAHMTYDGVFVFGMYQKQALTKGLLLKGLGPKDVVVLGAVSGNLRVTDAARATVLARNTYEGSVTVDGKDTRRDGFLGFLTRLSTANQYSLTVKDNQSVVMSDFYIEQAEHGIRLEGTSQLPPGRVTIGCPDMDLQNAPKANKPPESTALTVHDYAGQVFFGPVQFYAGLKKSRIAYTGTEKARVHLFASLFYQTALSVRGAPPDRVPLVGNQGIRNVTADNVVTHQEARDEGAREALAALSDALDDLRRLGEVDLALRPTAK